MSISDVFNLANTSVHLEDDSVRDKIDALIARLDDFANTISNIVTYIASCEKTVDKIFNKYYQNYRSKSLLSYPLTSIDLLKLYLS